MRSLRTLFAAAAAASLFVCIDAFAQPPHAPPTVDANVVNTVDTNVVNVVRFDSLANQLSAGSSNADGATFLNFVAQGLLHAVNLSLTAPPDGVCRAFAALEIVDNVSLISLDKKTIAALQAVDGNTMVVTHDFATPIELSFDPSETHAVLSLSRIVEVPAGERCYYSAGATYEEVEP